MRVVVTGAFGFIGSAVVRRLVLAGHEVVAVTHRPAGAPVPDCAAERVVHADVRAADALRAALEGADGVCHLAGLTGVRESFDRPDLYEQVNVAGTGAVIDALLAQAGPSGRFVRHVQASTAAVYGVPTVQPISEDAPLAPTSPYGASKAAADQLVAARAQASGGLLGAVSLRPFNVAGAVAGRTDFSTTRIIPNALAVAAGRSPALEVNGDGAIVRDYVHVDDVAAAFVLALGACVPGTWRAYNLGARAASLQDVIDATEQVTGRPIAVRRNPPKPEPPELRADATRARTELGWEPTRSTLEQIIGDAWAVVGATQ